MSYDDALAQLRDVQVSPPAFTEVEQRRRWRAEASVPRRALLHATIATSVAIVGYLVLTARPMLHAPGQEVGHLAGWWRGSLATLLPAALLLWVVRLVRRPGVGPHMLARAVLWSNLVVGALIAGNFMTPTDRLVGAWIAVACAVAIVRLGTHGLDHQAPDEVFQPSRFRGHLLLALVMAFADAQTLMFSAAMQLRVGLAGWNLGATIVYAGPVTIAAMLMVLTVWGLYRLRTWALFLNLVANIAIAYYAIEGALNLSTAVAGTLAATAAVQMFLPVPILAVAVGDRRAGRPIVGGYAQRLLDGSVVLIAVAAIGAAIFTTDPSGWLSGPGQAFVRGLPRYGPPRLQPVRQLQGADFSGRDLHGEEFSDARMNGANLRGAFGGWDFRRTDLTGADLRDARLMGADFERATLVQADLRGANLRGASLTRTDLSRADARGAQLQFSTLYAAVTQGTDLRGADLTGVVARGALQGALLTDATCPDGTRADPTDGCAGREGRLTREDPRYEGLFVPVSGEMFTRFDCLNTSPNMVDKHNYLRFDHRPFVRVGEDRFVANGARLRIDRTVTPVRLHYWTVRCGETTYEWTQ